MPFIYRGWGGFGGRVAVENGRRRVLAPRSMADKPPGPYKLDFIDSSLTLLKHETLCLNCNFETVCNAFNSSCNAFNSSCHAYTTAPCH
eukprot:1160582-Pelagomonas_calceolata.AAC.2